MATGLDSSAYFAERLTKVGLSPELQEALASAGYQTFGSLAFAVSSTPGSVSDEAVVRWVRGLSDPLPSDHHISVIRRLLFEAQSMSIAELRDRVNSVPGEAPTKKLPTVERAERLKALRRRLPGLILTPETIPANRLVDNYVDQPESGVLSYVKADACISRAQEMDSTKREPSLKLQGGEIKLATRNAELRCTVSSDPAAPGLEPEVARYGAGSSCFVYSVGDLGPESFRADAKGPSGQSPRSVAQSGALCGPRALSATLSQSYGPDSGPCRGQAPVGR